MRIGLGQLDMGFENKEHAKSLCEEMMQKAAKEQVDFLVFPEMTLTGFTMKTKELGESFKDSETIGFFRENALKNQLSLCFGLSIIDAQKAENHCVIVSETGEPLLDYAKIHPFSFGTEAQFYTGGESLASCTIKNVVTSPFVCYDLRFPEIFQVASKNSILLVVIANWPRQRREHWMTLLKARAIENQAFVVGVNRAGHGGGLEYSGDSMVVSPLGEVLAHAKEGHGLTTVDISPEVAFAYRSTFPLKLDRKPELYSKFLRSHK